MRPQLNQQPLTAEQLAERLRTAALLKSVMATLAKAPPRASDGLPETVRLLDTG